MRNLLLSACLNTGGDVVEASLASCSAMAIDSLTPCVFLASAGSIAALNSGRISSKIDVSEQMTANDRYVTFDYLPDEMLLCFSLSSGNIVTVEPSSSTLEPVGAVAGGIVAGAWSPDLELLVLVGGEERKLLVMTRSFDLLGEYDMETDSFGQDQLMTIGWGSKETQFQGSLGKQAATAKEEAAVSTNEWDDGSVRISWRGDGQYFAVCSVSPIRNCRVVRIWTRDGIHSSTCNAVPGMEHSLSWKPSGALIATSVHRQAAHEIVFFERNGQKRSQFDLRSPASERTVVQLLWNSDSTVLAVHSKSMSTNEHAVQLWTVSNYHWHLKYTHAVAGGDEVAAAMWDPETALDLHIVLRSGRYLRLSFCWSVDVSPHDFATVAVIDGAAIRVTPFGKFVIPPPMAKLSIATSAPVNQIAWSKHGRLAALLHNNTIATFTIADDGWKNDQVLAAESLPSDSIVYRIAWNGDGQLTAVLAKANWTLISMRLDANAWRIQDTLHTSDVPIIANCAVKDGHYLQLANGDWLQRRNDSTTPFEPMLDEGQAVRFRSPNCFSCAVVVVDDVAKAIGLASTYQLYVNNKELATNVNSFAIHDEFVLVTTLAHQLHCIELKSLRAAAGELSLGAGRAVERGSRLVCACAASTRVILQMPRGNLEAIDPRPLVLHALKRLIDERMYLQALMCMKRHRINMNLLYDHDPQKLTENMAEFVEKISDPLLLNLFLMDLVDDDTTRSMYADFYASDKGNAPLTTAGKVDRVCRLVRQALDRLSIEEQRRRLTAILTTYAKLSRPEVDCALLRMKQVAALVESCDAATLIDEALRYLLYIVDAETLFNMALATYDLDLVLMVAERSQKDPKEYLPLLNKLRRMDASYMKYTIEMHLERFATALLHIEQCSEDHFPEAVDLIKKHQLFRESLQVFAKSDKYQTICSMYADHCNQKRQYAEAALLFQNAGELNKAFEAYCDGLLWRELIALAKQIGIDQARLTETLKHVATKLESHKRFEEAAEIYEHHLLAINSAVTSYCAAGAWAKALCATANSGQSELIEAIILPALKQRADQMTESAQRWTTELRTHCERLQIVRANKSNRLLTWVESGEADFAESEVYSEASTAISSTSTTSSMRSGQSMSSSRRPRRGHMERKKASMKEGSKYEDLARMGVVRQIIVDIDAAQDELGPLLTTLVRLRMNELGGKVQQEFCTLITYARSLLTDVWPAFWQAHLLPGPLEELYKGPDGIIRFPTAGAMPDRLAIEPQMIPPTIRSVFWELDMLRQL